MFYVGKTADKEPTIDVLMERQYFFTKFFDVSSSMLILFTKKYNLRVPY